MTDHLWTRTPEYGLRVEDGSLWTLKDIARHTGLSISTLWTYRTRGLLPPPDVTDRHVPLWYPETIRQWDTTRRRRGDLGYRPTH